MLCCIYFFVIFLTATIIICIFGVPFKECTWSTDMRVRFIGEPKLALDVRVCVSVCV